ncbi:MAG: hypothetical protein LC723_13415 [Actinobacteria bacterium]|nr:hypothetical protein [Actinomycetota bacterium]
MGIELEGGWNTVPKGGQVIRDGSVLNLSAEHIGELVSEPLEVKKYEAWMLKFYPHHVNATCGLHVHQSFESAMNYQRLMDPSYPATIVAGITDWAKRVNLPKGNSLWNRLVGGSEYCQHIFHADEQAAQATKDYDKRRDGHRYTVINYPFSRTQTVECRLLPMMPTAELGVSAVSEVIRITNAYLAATAKRETRIETRVKETDVTTAEVYRVRV